jgi:transcriptional regulator with GAF, ATPase, and Fis domain
MAERTVLLEDKGRQALTMPGARLVVLRGPDKGRAYHLASEETVVGTGSTAQLTLSDDTVSRNHFVLRVTTKGYLVEDLGSTNGTLLDGRRIQSAYLRFGDRIALGVTQLRLEEQRQPVHLALSGADSFGALKGHSLASRRLFALLERVAPEDTSVLLLGETGTGKDLAAQALHDASPRANQPFVVVDCSALVGALMESELFGHEKGSFTGATATRIGAFEEADGGTLFLDEVGELPKELQPKLLRALERREVRRVGSNRPRPVDVRLIAATHRDLKLEVNRGSFREDLFYRLNVVPIRLPALRERADDIQLLAQHFWRELSGDTHARVPQAALNAFLQHDWPGNVRELRNRVERALHLDHVEISAVKTPLEGRPGERSYREAKARATEAFDVAFVTELLDEAGGNLSEAARKGQMDRVYLTKLVRKYGIRRPTQR